MGFSRLGVKVSITLSHDWGCDDVFLGGMIIALQRVFITTRLKCMVRVSQDANVRELY